MSGVQLLKAALLDLSNEERIDVIIETGTYLGEGSTKIAAEVFHDREDFRRLYTMESNKEYFEKAQTSLAKYPKVTCLNGLSVRYRDAVNFIRKDPVLDAHRDYPDIYIDDVEDPRKFYLNEIGYGNRGGGKSLMNYAGQLFRKKRTALLEKCIAANENYNILFLLDSAGGIGWLEFQNVIRAMGGREYHMLLDDIQHLKHFRSYEYIKKSPEFSIIRVSEEHGWVLCKHRKTEVDL
jgi:hypothetical protein